MKQIRAKNVKTQNMWSVFFFRQEKKTVKCASGEVGRSSYVSAQKKKNYTPMPKCSVRKFQWTFLMKFQLKL